MNLTYPSSNARSTWIITYKILVKQLKQNNFSHVVAHSDQSVQFVHTPIPKRQNNILIIFPFPATHQLQDLNLNKI
jgi:hypothetical protein